MHRRTRCRGRRPVLSFVFGRRGSTFFALLRQQADAVRAGAEALRAFLWAGSDPAARQAQGAAIREAERRGDELERAVADRLKGAFLIPIKREDVYAISGKLEAMMDIIEGVANRVELYAIVALTPEVLAIADLLPGQAAALVDVVTALQSLRRSAVSEAGQRCKTVEAEIDKIYRAGVARLFRTPDMPPLEVLKLKEVLERLEEASDHCEDVTRLVEGILIQRG